MENLAGRPTVEVDETVSFELARCRIDSFRVPLDRGEVQTTIRGKIEIGGLKIALRRAWRYWVAEGLVPLPRAQILYDSVVGKEDIRVCGDCSCPPPSGNNIRWIVPSSGRVVLPMSQKTECERLSQSETQIACVAKGVLADHDFSDEPEALGAFGFVPLYHIDTELGLYIFREVMYRPEIMLA